MKIKHARKMMLDINQNHAKGNGGVPNGKGKFEGWHVSDHS